MIAAIRFDALQEMVQDTPEVAVRVYASVLRESCKACGAAGRDQKKGARKKSNGGGKNGKKGRRSQ